MTQSPVWSATNPLGGLPLRRALVVAAVVSIVLPLLVVATALTGFADVRRVHTNAIDLLTAQQYQQDADMMHDAIHADVLAGVVNVTGLAEVDQSIDEHIAQLSDDLRRLDAFPLPAALASEVDRLGPQLKAYGAQGDLLVELARSDPGAARAQLPAFEAAFQSLEGPQAALTDSLAVVAAEQNAVAERRQQQAVRWTVGVATAMLAVLLLLAFSVYRLGAGNEVLVRRLRDSGEQIAFSNDELQDAQRLAHIGSWQWDITTGATQWSPEFYRILGLDPDTEGNHQDLFAARVHPDDVPAVEQARDKAAASGGAVHSHYRIVRPDGTIRDIRALGGAIRDDSGEVVRMVGTVQDITEQRAVERMKEEFVAVISHELRTPLTSIRGALGLMAGGAVGTLPDKAQRMADVALNSCQRLVRLVNDILDVEKMAAGKLELDLAALPVADLVGAAIAEMSAMADQAGVTITAVPMDAVVLADRDRIAQTLTNLLSNAIKFSPEGGTVTVSAGPAPVEAGGHGLVLFTVTDQGDGIPTDKLETIFDRFAQADATDTRAKVGTGLGLPICRGIVEQHGGRIWATSTPGQGSTFTFILRAAPTAAADEQTGPRPVGAVLICDDDPDVVEVLAAMLETHGYSTLAAHTGQQAVDLATDQAPSLILMDLRMPGMSGWETIAALGSNPATTHIPIVILSALAPDDIAVPAASAWLTKPVDQGALMSSLRMALGTDAPTTVLVIEDDPQMGEVLKGFFTDHGVHARVAHTGMQAVAMSREVPPDLLVLDLGLPDIDGYAVVNALRRDERLRALPMVVYTGRDLDAADRSRLRLGETRFVTKAGESPADFERQVIALLRTITSPTSA